MRYLYATAAATIGSAVLIVGLVIVRTAVDRRIAFLLERDQEIRSTEALVLRAGSFAADYGWLLILPIFVLSFYATRSHRRVSRGENSSSDAQAKIGMPPTR